MLPHLAGTLHAPRDAMAHSDDEPDGVARPAGETAQARFDLLYRDQAPRLRRRLGAQLKSSEEARDLVQDAFARLIGAGARQALNQPEAFLNRIIRNLLIDRSRRRAVRGPHVPIDTDVEPAVRPTQADGLELAQMRERYRAAVDALPARTRDVFRLHRIDGLSYKEIALRLKISPRTAEWHVAEALVRIGRCLEEE